MKTITFNSRGESSDFWPEFNEDGTPKVDLKSGQLAGEFRVTFYQDGMTMECPDAMADNMVQLGYAVEGGQAPE